MKTALKIALAFVWFLVVPAALVATNIESLVIAAYLQFELSFVIFFIWCGLTKKFRGSNSLSEKANRIVNTGTRVALVLCGTFYATFQLRPLIVDSVEFITSGSNVVITGRYDQATQRRLMFRVTSIDGPYAGEIFSEPFRFKMFVSNSEARTRFKVLEKSKMVLARLP